MITVMVVVCPPTIERQFVFQEMFFAVTDTDPAWAGQVIFRIASFSALTHAV